MDMKTYVLDERATAWRYPKVLPSKIEQVLTEIGCANIRQEKCLGWDNQPEVFIFEATEEQKRLVSARFDFTHVVYDPWPGYPNPMADTV